jgi:hypothetical protein
LQHIGGERAVHRAPRRLHNDALLQRGLHGRFDLLP